MQTFESNKTSTRVQAKPERGQPFFAPSVIQPKLTINEPGDQYEQEADAMADRVMRMSTTPAGNEAGIQAQPLHVSGIQRKCTACEQEDKLQRQKMEEEPIQAYPLMRKVEGGGYMASSQLTSQLNHSKGGGSPLPGATLASMNQAFGADFSQVRIHTGSQAAEMSQGIQAKAFTHGSDIYFNRGQYSPDSPEGKRLLGHELTHVVQQGMGVSGIQRQRMTSSRDIYETNHEGTNYRVRRTRVPRTRRSSEFEPTRAGIDFDSDNVTINISWCRGTRGEVRIGANLTGQALALAQEIAGIIARGGDADEVLEAIRRTDVTPFVETVIARSGQWRIFIRGDITVSREGITAGSGSIGIRRGPVDLEIAGEGSEEGGSLTGRVRITPGRTDEEFSCRREVVRETFINRYLCERMVPAHRETRTRTVERDDNQTHYIYFNYANEVIDEGRSQPSLDAIRDLLGQGYRVLSIEGFTSPEGPIRPGRRFVGNQQLGQDRADAGIARIRQICSELGSPLNMRGRPCVENVLTDVIPLGQGELFGQVTADDGTTRELRGREMQQHTIDEFRADEREAPHRTEAFMQSLEGLTPAEQADRIYPLLRRAVVVLSKVVSEQQSFEEDIPAGYREAACPARVIEDARVHFRGQDIF